MKLHTTEEKYYECRGTLEHVLRALQMAYNQGMFNGPQKKYIFTLVKDIKNSLKFVQE